MAIGPLMLDLEGLELTLEEQGFLSHPFIGGVIYFTRNYESAEQIKRLTDSIRRIRPELLIAVDQEGGRVQRFRDGFTRLPAMQKFLPLYRKNAFTTLALVKDSAWLMASELLAVGIDFSFAPVLDLDDFKCDVIADRSFSSEAEETIALSRAWIAGMHEAGMAATGKHFPGHGSVTADSHLALPVDDREFSDIASKDLLPFIALSNSLDAIMPAHIVFSKVDPDHAVGFSPYWLQTILRKDLGFDGVIFSDDLTMEGAASGGTFVKRAQLALSAGCDMILVCNHRAGVLEILRESKSLDYESSAHRLDAMRSTKLFDLTDIKKQPRWRLSQQLLSAIA